MSHHVAVSNGESDNKLLVELLHAIVFITATWSISAIDVLADMHAHMPAAQQTDPEKELDCGQLVGKPLPDLFPLLNAYACAGKLGSIEASRKNPEELRKALKTFVNRLSLSNCLQILEGRGEEKMRAGNPRLS